MPASTSEGRSRWRKRKRDHSATRKSKLKEPEKDDAFEDNEDDEDPDLEPPQNHLETEDDPHNQSSDRIAQMSRERESENLMDGGWKICDNPAAIKRVVNEPHSSVFGIVEAERDAGDVESRDHGHGGVAMLENVTHGQLLATLYAVHRDRSALSGASLQDTESGSGIGSDVVRPPEVTPGPGFTKRLGSASRAHVVPAHAGTKIDLASVRARKAALGTYTSCDIVRRQVSSLCSESTRISESHALKKASSSLSNRDSNTMVAKDDRGEAMKRVHDKVRKKAEDEKPRQPKKIRVEDPGASSKPSFAKHIFVDGVNHIEKADSFWDLDDPEIGWKKGRSIVGDFDMLHLLSLPSDSFTHALFWNSCQGLSLASAVRVREEKLQNENDKLHEEVRRLKDENRILSEEKKKGDAELLQAQRDLAGKVKDFVVLEEKYVMELKNGDHFLDSETGKAFLKNVEETSVRSFKASSAFHDEVLDQAVIIHDDVVLACRDQLRNKGVSEEIVMMIEPSVLEVNAILTDDISLGDDEIIDVLKSRLMRHSVKFPGRLLFRIVADYP